MLSHSQQRTLGLGRPRPRLQVVRLAKERPAQVGVPVGRRERALARGASEAGLVEEVALRCDAPGLRHRLVAAHARLLIAAAEAEGATHPLAPLETRCPARVLAACKLFGRARRVGTRGLTGPVLLAGHSPRPLGRRRRRAPPIRVQQRVDVEHAAIGCLHCFPTGVDRRLGRRRQRSSGCGRGRKCGRGCGCGRGRGRGRRRVRERGRADERGRRRERGHRRGRGLPLRLP